MLKIRNASLATSAVKPEQFPEPLPSIALFGRSNAGKSSLINTLIQRKNLARTSGAPGKTRLLNFYLVEAVLDEEPLSFYFVDLPGYGYAKVSKAERASWLNMIERYLSAAPPLACWQLVDIRHAPSAEDKLMRQALLNGEYELLTVANKIDKVSRNQLAAGLKVISQDMAVDKGEIVPFSAISRQGREDLLLRAENLLKL